MTILAVFGDLVVGDWGDLGDLVVGDLVNLGDFGTLVDLTILAILRDLATETSDG